MLTKQALYTIESSEDWSKTTYTLKIVDDLVTLETEDTLKIVDDLVTLETEDNKEELYLGNLEQALVVVGETLKALKEVKNGD